MEIRQVLKKARMDAGLTMQELADRLNAEFGFNINKSTVSRWESGTFEPTNKFLVAYSKFFGLDYTSLLGVAAEPETRYTTDTTELTPRDKKHIDKILEQLLDGVEKGETFAAHGGTVEDAVELELLKRSLQDAITHAKKIAKAKYTPKKYRK